MAAPVARCIDSYLNHLTVERGLSRNTLSSYRRDLARYTEFLFGVGVTDLADVAESHVGGFRPLGPLSRFAVCTGSRSWKA